MISKSTAETFVYEAVRNGCLEIRPDGTIWRVAYERTNRWNDDVTFTPCPPKQLASKPKPSDDYLMIKIMRRNRQVSVGAHRLVYLHFCGPIPPGLTINHKNGVTTDNRPDNLELATYAEQTKHAFDVLGREHREQNGEANAMSKLSDGAVREIRRRRAAGETVANLAVAFGVRESAISRIANRKRWPHIA